MDPITRSAIWFDDGSVILQAEKTQFRVHRSMLSRHSSVFQDMFSIPQPLSEPVIEGCAIIRVSDSSQDWEALLTLMYDNLRVYQSNDRLPIPLIAVMLRLGRKYDMEHFFQEAVARLNYEFPNTQSHWDLVSRGTYTKLVNSGDSMVLDIINLAREAGLQSILPTAYYVALIDGENPMERLFSTYISAYGSAATVAPDIQKILVLGREKLLKALGDNTFAWLADDKCIPHANCPNPSHCASARVKLIAKVWIPIPDINLAMDEWDRSEHGTGLCNVCARAAVGRYETGRRLLWEELPSYLVSLTGRISPTCKPDPNISYSRVVLPALPVCGNSSLPYVRICYAFLEIR